jgi:DNA helicase-2/ATP-dependent DNA helicase PcrA
VSPDDFAGCAAALSAAAVADVELIDRAAAQQELARAYAAYSTLLTERGLIDHADQIALPLRLLRERPAVRQQLHSRFRYILVDELQDANAAQLDFVLELAAGSSNVMVVGDPDQGIYDFRGASSANVSRFAAAFPAVRRIALKRNYRSRRPIIEASQRLLAHNHAALDEGRPSQVAARRSRREEPVGLSVYQTAEEEADAVAAQIAERIANGEQPQDFAVLVRSNAESASMLRSLLARGVAADNGARPDLLRLPAVRSLLAFLRVVADPGNSLELYALATSAPYRLPATLLNPSLQSGRRRSRSLWETLEAAIDDERSAVGADDRRRAADLIAHVRAGIEKSARSTSAEVLHDYLRRSGTLARLAGMSAEGADTEGLRGIARFAGIVRGRASLLATDRVPFLVPHLERLSEQETELELDGPLPDHVAVLTVHRAKGLEFKVVYLCGLVDGRFPVRARPPLFSLPAELTAHNSDQAELSEERRLFYVAMTRARDELRLSYHRGGRYRRRPSPFIAEAVDLPPALPASAQAGAAHEVERIESLLAPAPVPQIPPRSTAGSLSLSYSQVDEYLSCPERYRLRYVVGLSTPAHHALAYGSALHQTIAAFHVAQGQGSTMTEDELLAEFDRHWTPDGFLSREHEEARYAAGRETLRRFRQRELEHGVTPVAIERPFRFQLGRDQIVGRIDRLDMSAAGVVITDYKSSAVDDQKRADAKARESLQLQVYALAHQAETGEPPARVQLHFLDSGVVGAVRPDPDKLERAKQTLATVADGIRAGNFQPKPSPLGCGYCPFREICTASVATNVA